MGRKLQGMRPGGFGFCLSGPPGCYRHYVSPKYPSTGGSSPSKQLLPSLCPLPLQSLVPFSLFVQVSMLPLVQSHPLSLLLSSILPMGTLHRILPYWVSAIPLAMDRDSDNKSNIKGVRAHLLKRITSCRGWMDRKELLKRVTRGSFGRRIGSD